MKRVLGKNLLFAHPACAPTPPCARASRPEPENGAACEGATEGSGVGADRHHPEREKEAAHAATPKAGAIRRMAEIRVRKDSLFP